MKRIGTKLLASLTLFCLAVFSANSQDAKPQKTPSPNSKVKGSVRLLYTFPAKNFPLDYYSPKHFFVFSKDVPKTR